MKYVKLALAGMALTASTVWAQSQLERGKYLVEGILTCGNCHTPRGPKGVLDKSRLHAGGPQVWDTAESTVRPSNITPDKETGIGEWSRDSVVDVLLTGTKPDLDNVQGLMAEVIEAGYKNMKREDALAIVEYLKTVPPVKHKTD